MKYRIRNAINRANTNLTNNNIASAIIQGVHKIFPNATVNIYRNYFEVLNVYNSTKAQLQQMGREIVYRSQLLINIIKTYTYVRSNGQIGRSNQVFHRFN